MGHGPAKNRSTNDQSNEFAAQALRNGSIAQLAVGTFRTEYPKSAISPIANEVWDSEEALRIARRANPLSNSVQAWETSKDEFARWLLAAQSLVAQTKIEKASKLKITVGTSKPEEWEIPTHNGSLGQGVADLNGKFDNEVWLQDAGLVLFMIQVVKDEVNVANFNMKFLGLAIDVAAQAIPSVLFEAKARAASPRPYELDPLHPVALPKPEHSSWPGGHAFWCGALCELLYEAVATKVGDPKDLKTKLRKAAKRIANNRVRAGLHWPQDTEDGISQGEFVMKKWIDLSTISASQVGGYPGDAGDLWRLISQV